MRISFSTIRPFCNLQITFWSLTSSGFICLPLTPPYIVTSVVWSLSISLMENLAFLIAIYVIYLMKLLGFLGFNIGLTWEADDESLIWWVISPGASSFFSYFTFSLYFWIISQLVTSLEANDDLEIIELIVKFDFIPPPSLITSI